MISLHKIWLFFVLFFISLPVFSYDYWNTPEVISKGDCRFPTVASNGEDSYIFYQEVDTNKEEIWLSARFQDKSGRWIDKRRFIGPFSYSGEVPDMYSASVSKNGTIAIVVLSATNKISVYVSKDKTESFKLTTLQDKNNALIAPRIFCTSSGRFLLFASVSKAVASSGNSDVIDETYSDHRFYLYYAYSDDGLSWSSFNSFGPTKKFLNPFSPTFCSSPLGDFVVFQSQLQIDGKISYQLYGTYSENNGSSWQEPFLITSALTAIDKLSYNEYYNQRPNICFFDSSVHVAWERRGRYDENDSIWVCEINKDGLIPKTCDEIANKGKSRRANLFVNEGQLWLTWFDTRSGQESIYCARKTGVLWSEIKYQMGKSANFFPSPFFVKDTRKGSEGDLMLAFVWQRNSGSEKEYVPSISVLTPDLSVVPPRIDGLTVKNKERSRSQKVRYKINLPMDPSGIAGYVYLWTKDPSEVIDREEAELHLPKDDRLNLTAASEGYWYLKVSALDYAGNWSDWTTSSYYYDQTPPKAITFNPLELDEAGFLKSSTFKVVWHKDERDTDIQGYSYELRRITGLSPRYVETTRYARSATNEESRRYIDTLKSRNSKVINKRIELSDKPKVTRSELSYKNLENGLYVLTVSAVDKVGYLSPERKLVFLVNKWVPVTEIRGVSTSFSDFGDLSLSLKGIGFKTDGEITEVYIDSDGKAPFDESSHTFTLSSDSEINDIKLSRNLGEGSYYIALKHSYRGIFITKTPILTIEESGTVKIDNPFVYVPQWKSISKQSTIKISTGLLVFLGVLLLSVLSLLYFSTAVVKTVKQTKEINRIVYESVNHGALMDSTIQVSQLRNRVKVSQTYKRNGSLLYKLMGFTFSLITVLVVSAAIPLYQNKIYETEKSLASSLSERIEVLLYSLTSGAKTYMPTKNTFELNQLPEQCTAIPEAEFATITGFYYEDSGIFDNPSEKRKDNSLLHVWVSNDRDIIDYVDQVQEFSGIKQIIQGVSLMTLPSVEAINEKCLDLNKSLSEKYGETSYEIKSLYTEAQKLLMSGDSSGKISKIQSEINEKKAELNRELEDYARDGSGSYPEFSNDHLNKDVTSYLFYRPVLFMDNNSSDFVHGIVFVQISTGSLVNEVELAVRKIIVLVITIVSIVLTLGAIASLVISYHLTTPLKKLERFVQTIANEKQKEKLAGDKHNVNIRQNDEIGRLGDAMNRLKDELVMAAIEEKLTNDGKAVQKAFLPLDKTSSGIGQKTTASYSDDSIECFGYYEGASAISGDYFDYQKLDDRWYVFIKSDASGHGTPAGLIMTVVATLFHKFFENWHFGKLGTDINELVYQINDFLESLRLKGKFATIITILYDSQTGKMYVCNAGDNIIHIYNKKESSLKTLFLRETPAAGPFPSDMIDWKGGFQVEVHTLDKDDILFLYTDGIEEATRSIRDVNYQTIQTEVNGKVGDKKESLEAARIKTIIEAVFDKSTFELIKEENPEANEHLIFDFTNCEGTLREAIIALVSVEKVFRLYKPRNVFESDTVVVDKNIDAFLKAHFNLYDKYCIEGNVPEDLKLNYVVYKNIMEDEQADDLTLLAIHHK